MKAPRSCEVLRIWPEFFEIFHQPKLACASWWLNQPLWKKSQNGFIFPKVRGEHKKYEWNHHLVIHFSSWWFQPLWKIFETTTQYLNVTWNPTGWALNFSSFNSYRWLEWNKNWKKTSWWLVNTNPLAKKCDLKIGSFPREKGGENLTQISQKKPTKWSILAQWTDAALFVSSFVAVSYSRGCKMVPNPRAIFSAGEKNLQKLVEIYEGFMSGKNIQIQVSWIYVNWKNRYLYKINPSIDMWWLKQITRYTDMIYYI